MAWQGDVYPSTYKALFMNEDAYGVNLHVEATGTGCVVKGNTAAGAATIGLRLTGSWLGVVLLRLSIFLPYTKYS